MAVRTQYVSQFLHPKGASKNRVLKSPFLGLFAKLRKPTISFVVSVCVSVHMEQFCSHWKDFDETWYLSFFFRKSVYKTHISLKSDKVTVKTYLRLWQHLTKLFLDKSCRENQNTHLCSIAFFQKSYLFEIMWKNMVEPNPSSRIVTLGST